MVYTSDYYTTRSYSRPVTSSYTVSYPVSTYSTGKSTVYTASNYPMYTYNRYPYVSSRVYSSPYYSSVYSSPIYTPLTRTVTTRVIRSPSPVRTITTTRVIRSPSPYRVLSTPLSYTRVYSSPVRVISSPTRVISYPSYRPYIASPYLDRELSPLRVNIRTSPATLAREYDRILHKVRPSYGYRPLEQYYNSESFINFDSETRRIRSEAHSLLRDIHSRIPRRHRSVTPYYTMDDAPHSHSGLASYIDRITDPTRHLIREVRSMSLIPESPRKYMGTSHLASMRIVGDRPYSVRHALYNPDQIRNDINLLSYYSKNRRAASEKQNHSEEQGASSLKDLDPNRPSRKFGAQKHLEDPNQELKDKQRERQERLAGITEETDKLKDKIFTDAKLERQALREESARIAEQARKAEESRKGEESRAAEEARKVAEQSSKAEEARKAAEAQAAEEAKLAEAKKAQLAAEASKAKAEEAKKAEAAAKAAEEAKLAEEAKKAEEAAKAAEEARLAEEAAKAAEEARLAEEAAKAAEEAKLAEEAAKAAEEAKLAEEAAKAVEEARIAEEAAKAAEEARLAEEASKAAAEAETAEEDEVTDQVPPTDETATESVPEEEQHQEQTEEERIAEEERLLEEQKQKEEELLRLAEFEKNAKEEEEIALANQAAELAEIARQEVDITAKKLEECQNVSNPEDDKEPTVNGGDEIEEEEYEDDEE